MILSGGMHSAAAVREAFEQTGVAAVMLARGALGNPWLFEEVLGRRDEPPGPAEVLAELDWVIAAACEHVGVERAGRYLRRFYPWYLERLPLSGAPARAAGGRARQRPRRSQPSASCSTRPLPLSPPDALAILRRPP